MPLKCCVPYCRGNYDVNNKVKVFQFPADANLRKLWINRISRQDFIPTKYSRVCERHFAPSCIETSTEAFDEKEGKIISAPLERFRLKKDAVPTIFEQYPAYKSAAGSSRESPATKRLREEGRQVEKAVKESLVTIQKYNNSRTFKDLNELMQCLKKFKVSSFWDVISHDDSVMFLNLQIVSGSVKIFHAVHIDKNLYLTYSHQGEKIEKFNDHKFPMHINNINDLQSMLGIFEKYDVDVETNSIINIILSLLNTLIHNSNSNCNEKHLQFLQEQLSLSVLKPENCRYSPDTLIFASMFYMASPVAYKFVRNSGEIILPHTSTIHKLCAKYNINPQDEVREDNFLAYARQRQKSLSSEEMYVSLMMDEIHIKELFDFKGGNIVGHSHNNVESANSAHVFMVQSLLSKFKDVIYILPVKTISADVLFDILKRIIIRLEDFGYKVIVIVSDNNSINRKCVSKFNNPLSDYVYPHPCDKNRPLFYSVDSVHLIKSVRNNWVNQKNKEQAMFFPDFDSKSNKVLTASLLTVKKLYEIESGSLLKHGYTLSQKVLWPSSLEKQNVKLALQLLNVTISESLLNLGPSLNLLNYSGTSEFIKIFARWFSVMNVKSPNKGTHLRDIFSKPLTTSEIDNNFLFLHEFIEWLHKYKTLTSDTGRLTRETLSGLLISTSSMIELTKYCTDELGFSYLLPGKIQTDELENRFSLYRRMAGTNYHISLRQIMEVEKKLRTCNVLKLELSLNQKILVEEIVDVNEQDENVNLNHSFLSIHVTEQNINNIKNDYPLLTFLAGYCIHSVLFVKLKCDNCKNNLTIDRMLAVDPSFKVICSFDRGGLKYPTVDVVNVIIHNFIVLKKLVTDFEELFLKQSNQREVVTKLTLNILKDKDILVAGCSLHSYKKIMLYIVRSCTNTLLKNYCKTRNDELCKKLNKRKLTAISS